LEDTVGVQIGNTVSDDSTKQAHINKCYHWRDADYEGIGNFLANYDWNQLFSLYPSVNEWTAFSDVMYCAIDMFVPTLNKSTHSGKRHYPKKVRKAFARKRCLWRRYRANRGNSLLRQCYLDVQSSAAVLCLITK